MDKPQIEPVYRAKNDSLHTPDGPTNWIVATKPPHRFGGVSLMQCPTCFALVVEDFLADHMAWHERHSADA